MIAMNKSGNLDSIPFLGSGIGLRLELLDDITASKNSIDFIEVVADQFLDDISSRRKLAKLRENFKIIPHGIGLSIGSVNPPDEEYLRSIKDVIEIVSAPYYSEHLAMTNAPGIEIGHLSPLWYTEDALKYTIENVYRVQDYLGIPLVLENVTYLFSIPNSELSQTEFFHRLVEATDCGILLDVTNIYTNSKNHSFDPVSFLEEMPLDRVVQAHIAGGYFNDGLFIDSHSEKVEEGSWDLLRKLCNRTSIKGCILEHDDNFPTEPLVLVEQVNKARDIMNGIESNKRH